MPMPQPQHMGIQHGQLAGREVAHVCIHGLDVYRVGVLPARVLGLP